MTKFFIKNMGCKSNQLEGALISENLRNEGYIEAKSIEETDIFILNSCTVTHKSDNEAFHILMHSKKKHPNIKTVLTGCVAQIEKEKVLDLPYVDFVFGNNDKLELGKHLKHDSQVSDIMDLNKFHAVLLNDTTKTRASLKIQDGCNNRCSYCIIPFARGKNRSADLDFILNQIKIFEDAGFKEIVLTGIHIGQWGLDFEDKKNLLYLLQNIEEKTNIKRFRMGSLNPLEIDAEILKFLKNSEKFCPHFHLSLQSMCDKTLKNMNRKYSVARELELIEQISESFENPFMGSDIIAGFVGETEDDFAENISNLKKSKLSQIHTFPYSIRKGTVAEKMEGHLSDKIKTQRADIIKEISAQKYNEFLNNCDGTIQEVLLEKHPDKHTGLLKGVTRNYIKVLVNSPFEASLSNTLCNVKIARNEDNIFGEICQ